MAKIKLTKEVNNLYTELKKLSKTANQRILQLERSYTKENVAVKDLRQKLELENVKAWTKGGRVRVSKKMSEEQLKATLKATKNFLRKESLTTKRGIKKAKKRAFDTLRVRFSDEIDGEDLSDEDILDLVNFFDDDEVNDITNYIPGSDVIAIIEESREKESSYTDFSSMMNSIVTYNKGSNIENLLRKIYSKYVYKGNNNNDTIDMLYENVLELVNNANTEDELNEVSSIVETLINDGKISDREYNYLTNIIEEKRLIL